MATTFYEGREIDLLRLTNSPWGAVQHITQLAEGIVMIDTASHGGIKVSDDLLAKMPEALRRTPYSGGGWFEEDCDWAFVAVCFPDAFKAEHVEMARKTIAMTYPNRMADIPT